MNPDMSSQAVTRRIKAASDLRDLCLKLGHARPMQVKEGAPEYKTRSDLTGR